MVSIKSESVFIISIDADWVSQPLLNDTANILNDFRIKGTFFLTNKIDENKLENHELAIHPNFYGAANYDEVLERTLNILTTRKSKGSRSHKLFYDTPLMASYKKYGIEYDSNYYLSNYDKPMPFFFQRSQILEIPFFFADDSYFFLNSNFELDGINLQDSGVKVFLFHPFHIFMNSNSLDDYQRLKPYYTNYEYLNTRKNYDKPGIRNLFIKLLEFIENRKVETKTMAEINEIWRTELNNIR